MDAPDPPPTHPGLRAAGFLLVAVGALLAGLGALTAWVEVGLAGFQADAITPVELGVDRPEGIAVLVLAGVAVVATLVARIGRTGARGRAAGVSTIAGLGIVVACVMMVALGTRRFEVAAIDRIRALPEASRPSEELIDGIAELTEARLRPGLWLSLGGGVVVVAGGLVTVAWTRRVHPASAVEPASP